MRNILERAPVVRRGGKVKSFGKFLKVVQMSWSFMRFGKEETMKGAKLARALCDLEIDPFTERSVDNYRHIRIVNLFSKLRDAGVIKYWQPSYEVKSTVYPDRFTRVGEFSAFVEKIKPRLPGAKFVVEEVRMGDLTVIQLFFVAYGSKKFCLEACEELKELRQVLESKKVEL
ncbi:MAG: hypothetical protein U1D31_01415 [Patescibacteria group bacterium]|nr:hypothetical protein [Patescibacteria group bacterium]